MTQGVFIEDIPLIQITLGWGQAVKTPFVVLDTGFTGDIQITPTVAQELGLEVVGVTSAKIANGERVSIPTALVLAAMEGEVQEMQVLISESMPLAGISFLSKFSYKAIVDCAHHTVSLERVTV